MRGLSCAFLAPALLFANSALANQPLEDGQEQVALEADLAWVLGIWSLSGKAGEVRFEVQSDGTISGYIHDASKDMIRNGYRPGMQFLRGFKMRGRDGISWAYWADGGEYLNSQTDYYGKTTAQWQPYNALIYIQKDTENLAFPMDDRLGGYFSKWVKRDGGIVKSLSDSLGELRDQILGVDQSGSPQDRMAVAALASDRIGEYRETSVEAAEASSLLGFLRDRARILSESSLAPEIDALENTPTLAEEKAREREIIQSLGGKVLDRADHFAQMRAGQDFSAEDAAKLFNMAKYASTLRDDLGNLSDAAAGNGASSATKFLKTAYGIATIEGASEDRDANTIMSGIRNLAASAAKSTGLSTFLDVPGSVAASTTEVSRQGFLQSADALAAIDAAMKSRGDPADIRRAVEASRKLDNTLSGASYGEAMQGAITKRLTDKIPVVRTIANWFF